MLLYGLKYYYGKSLKLLNKKREKSQILSFLKEQNRYNFSLLQMIQSLNIVFEKFYQFLFTVLSLNDLNKILKHKKSVHFFISYIIHFRFSLSNTFLHVSDSSGNFKMFHSSGSLGFKGKKNRVLKRLLLNKLFSTLLKFKSKFVKNSPVAFHFILKNFQSNFFFLIKKLKSKFFIKLIKTFSLYSFNGCRKKKVRRKKVRLKKKK